MHSQRDWFADGELCAEEIDLVVWIDFIVVGWVAEGEWKHALFLQVCLMLNVQVWGELMIFRRWRKARARKLDGGRGGGRMGAGGNDLLYVRSCG